jgi:hypothetical protein
MSTELTATVIDRDERHEIDIRLAVSGAPIIEDRHDITPTRVCLTYVRDGAQWLPWAEVIGLTNTGPHPYRKAAFEPPSAAWPEWLRALAERHSPANTTGQED